jgi:acetylornithine deacetylase/succinyl-diaminopimelate desuccinylase-like protein
MQDLLGRLKNVLPAQEITRLLAELVAFPTYRGVIAQETAAAQSIHRFFLGEGIESGVIPVGDGRCNVTARLRGRGGGKSLLLTTHLDTVPPYDMDAPCRPVIKGDFLYGRGAVDAKGALSCMIAAMAALKRAQVALSGDLLFAGVIDEENCSTGAQALINSGFTADAAVVGEPTALDLCLGHRGLAWLEIRFHGRTVHGGSQDKVLNTILMAQRFIQRVEETLVPQLAGRVHPLVGPASLNYGLIRGGTQPSTVPGECFLQLDRRWIPGEDYREIIRELEQVLESLQTEDPRFRGTLEVMPEGSMAGGWVHRPAEMDPAHPLVEIAADAVALAAGFIPQRRAFTAWSDAGILNGYGGIPTLILAPGDLSCAHSSAEHISLSSLLPAALTYALTAAAFCR